MMRPIKLAWAAVLCLTSAAQADARGEEAEKVLSTWYHMALELVRHTPTLWNVAWGRAF